MTSRRRPGDGYLSASTVHEAVDALEGLAAVLDRVDGVFAADAAADAAHLRELAAALTEWWPTPPVRTPAHRPRWEELLAVYVAHGFGAGPGTL